MKRSGAAGRTRTEKERDLAKIAALHEKGQTITEMAAILKMSRSTVWKDLQLLEERWKKDGMMDMQRVRMRQYREIRQAREEAWAAWAASKEPEKEVTQEEQKAGKGQGGARSKATVKTKHGTGNPNFLRMIKELISLEADLCGTKVFRVPDADENQVAVLSGGVVKIPAYSKPLPTKANGGLK
jgi:hypothetical protein